ncbi:laccase-2 [Plakobranchus ocellatus]|uniref:Laccase-2 n=1 Tax=Plakobranchus ocellatus TaxID=259542 RepID=A0AAV3Z153_9GAST|nr:laccase-2 [Plakobranchus ocellatus]
MSVPRPSYLAETVVLLVIAQLTSPVLSVCRESDEVCEFWLHLEHRLTMMKGREAVYAQGGQLYMWDDVSASQPINASEVITADGWETSRLVVSVNGSIPGPPIEVSSRRQSITVDTH